MNKTAIYQKPTFIDFYDATALQALNMRYSQAAIGSGIIAEVNRIVDKFNAEVSDMPPQPGDIIIAPPGMYQDDISDFCLLLNQYPTGGQYSGVTVVNGPYITTFHPCGTAPDAALREINVVGGAHFREGGPRSVLMHRGYSFRPIHIYQDSHRNSGLIMFHIPVKVWGIGNTLEGLTPNQ